MKNKFIRIGRIARLLGALAALFGFFVTSASAAGPGTVNLTVTAVGKRSEEHTSELQSQSNLVCRLLLEKKQRLGKASCFRDRSVEENLDLLARMKSVTFLDGA